MNKEKGLFPSGVFISVVSKDRLRESMERMQIPRINLPIFKGTTKENVVTWCKRMQNALTAMGVEDDTQKYHIAITYLEDNAFFWLDSQMELATSWNALQQAIRAAFQNERHQSLLRDHL